VGDEYKFVIFNGDRELQRNDPYAREVTNSVGNSVVVDPASFDWGNDTFEMPPWNELVIYEAHVGTFNREDSKSTGSFDDVVRKLEYLKWLGVNALQLMPVAEFAGDISWGYNPAHIFAVESAYGGPAGLKQLVKQAHEHGIAVILDVVYNHFGPSDLDLWQFDGWGENEKGGIYFYNDWRSSTPWGDTRPDYGRGEVRQFIFDNAMMWLDEYRMDGLRYDMTLYMRTVDGSDHREIPEGWSLAQWINREVRERFPNKILIAEDLRTNPALTNDEQWGGANFSSQWDEAFVHPIREVVAAPEDWHRDMNKVSDAIRHRYNLDAFQRVIYSESHDEVANGKKRVPSEIHEDDPTSYYARKRSTLAAAIVHTAPGIPMLFQAQEFLRYNWFDDTDPIEWKQAGEQDGVLRLYRDLVHLRLNHGGCTAGLTGQHVEVSHVNNSDKVIAFRRWKEGGPGDDVMVLANFSDRRWESYRIGFVQPGTWNVRLDSGAACYGDDFDGSNVAAISTQDGEYDRYLQSGSIPLTPYSVVILSQD
jgi:1,4-alpha-glucan branching enzyme